ncbi:unnamed protein product, partial [Owenia fusiformis]
PYFVGAVVQFGCEECYEFPQNGRGRPDNDVKCLPTFKFEESPVCQLKTCPPLEVPIGGFITEENNNCGGQVKFACAAGSSLVGEDTTKCLPSGQWSNPTPSCTQ